MGVYGSLIDLGFTTENGYTTTGGGSGFPDGFQCPQTEWWCESGDYRFLDGVLYTPESFPGINANYPWLWWENQSPSNEYDPNVHDSDPSVAWWDTNVSDPNTIYTQQNRPNWSIVNSNYPKTPDGNDDMSSHDVCVLIGGQVLTQYNLGNANNACCLRVSRALNYSGVNIPNIAGQTWTGADGKNYFYYTEHLYNWLDKTFGAADIHLTAADGAPNGIKFLDQLMGLQNRGIYHETYFTECFRCIWSCDIMGVEQIALGAIIISNLQVTFIYGNYHNK